MADTPHGLGLRELFGITNQKLANQQAWNPDNQYGGLKPWLDRPATWYDFTPSNIINIPAVGAESTILLYDVPVGQDGVITGLTVNYSASDYDTGDLVFRLYIDDRPVNNLGNILTNLGNSQYPWPLRVRVFTGNRVKLNVFHQANVTLEGKSVLGALLGYTYPRSMVS